MVSIMRPVSEQGSETDLDLHISDTEEDFLLKDTSADLADKSKSEEFPPDATLDTPTFDLTDVKNEDLLENLTDESKEIGEAKNEMVKELKEGVLELNKYVKELNDEVSPEEESAQLKEITSSGENSQLEELISTTEVSQQDEGSKDGTKPEEQYLDASDSDPTNKPEVKVEEPSAGSSDKNLDSTSNDSDQMQIDNDETDLLLVMEEKAADDDESEFNKSVLADEEQEIAEIKEDSMQFENSKSPPSSPTEEPPQDKTDITDSNVSAASPDELIDIGIVEVTEEAQLCSIPDTVVDAATETDTDDVVVKSLNEDCQIGSDGESNKENVEEICKTEEVEVAVSPPPEIASREMSRKRQSVDFMELDEKPKKFKAEKKTNPNSFSQFMLDKTLKGMTRDKLEVFVLQKICESLIYKTEVADLQKALRDKEGMIDSLRKEVVLLSKQAKDVNIVHDKIIQDLARFKNNPDRPLLVPRITRSVGLQAAITTGPPKPALIPLMPKPVRTNVRPAPPPPSPIVKPAKKMTQIQSPPMLRQIAAASPRPVPKLVLPKTPIVKSPTKATSPKKADSKGGVIDLTSDEDKKFPQLSQLLNGKMVTPPNGHKVVVVNGQSVMVKLGTQNNVIMNSNAMKVISSNASIRTFQPSILKTPNSTNTKTVFSAHPRPSVGSPLPKRVHVAKPMSRHPAPFPVTPQVKRSCGKPLPPKPQLKLSKTSHGNGIVLSWQMPYKLEMFEDIGSYQLYAYQETKSEPNTESWGKIGDVKALPLPMAVTLTQFALGNRYYFAVRAVDNLMRLGPFSDYQAISL